MKRKIEEKILNWKAKSNGKTALLIDGARRVGKSFIVEEFAKQNYKTYILIDFNQVGSEIKDLFDMNLRDLDSFFMYLSAAFNVKLYNRESLIIFDEVQL
jgi:AAA+ ATPase superfamily predicted ATPase